MNFKKILFPSILIALAAFNPHEEKYIHELSIKFKDELKQVVCKDQPFTPFGQSICNQMVSPVATNPVFKSGLKMFNERQNMLLFSIYTTDLGLFKIKAVGIAGQVFFLPIS
jgi:hypothetical protein